MKSFVLLFLALVFPTYVVCALSNKPSSGPQLDRIAKQNRKLYFGTATNGNELNDTSYSPLIDDNGMFGQITPANAMKWVSETR